MTQHWTLDEPCYYCGATSNTSHARSCRDAGLYDQDGTPTPVNALRCSSEGCGREAVETLFLRDQVGHVHDCSQHAALLREWSDVVHSEPLVDGECMAVVCTKGGIYSAQPKPLEW